MATSINSYSVSLGMDASGYVKGGILARNETRALIKDIEAARTPAERYENALERLTAAKAAGAIQTGTFIRLMDEEERKLKSLSATTEKQVSSTGALTGQIRGLVSGYIGLQTVTKSIRLAVDAEQAAAQFEVMAGSLNNSKFLVEQIRDFAAKSPVSLEGANQAAKTMLGFGIAVDQVAGNLKMLGDISGGNQQRFDSLTLAFSQMSAAGRLMGQDVLQMVNAGFNPLQEISMRTGESMIDLKKRMEDGAISSQEVTEAFRAATEEGGRFNGMTERMAETMGGKMMIASANLDLAMTKLGQSLGPVVIALTSGMEKGTSAIDKINGVIGTMADGIGLVVAAMNDLNGGGLGMMFSGGSNANTNAYLKMLTKRDIEAAEALKNKATGFDANEVANVEKVEKAKSEALQKLEREEFLMIEKLQREINAAADDRIRKEEQKRLEMQRRLSNEDLKAADDHFKKERENARKLQDDIAKCPSSMEAGSADAAKFMADQVNAAIAANVSPDQPKPTEEQMLAETIRQRELAEKKDARDASILTALEAIRDKKPDVSKFR